MWALSRGGAQGTAHWALHGNPGLARDAHPGLGEPGRSQQGQLRAGPGSPGQGTRAGLSWGRCSPFPLPAAPAVGMVEELQCNRPEVAP